MLDFSTFENHAAPGFIASTLIHTLNGLRFVSDLNVGDLILSPNKSNTGHETRKITRLDRIENAPIVKVKVAFQKQDESLFVAGLPYLFVSGLDPDVSSDPDYPDDWLRHLEKKLGWQEICRVEPGLRVHSVADSLAYLVHVDQVWKSKDASIGWTDPNRDSGTGYKIDFGGSEVIEIKDEVPVDMLADGIFEEEFAHCDRHDSHEIAGELAMRLPVFSIEVEECSPFFVGHGGLLVQSGLIPNSFGVWAHMRIWED